MKGFIFQPFLFQCFCLSLLSFRGARWAPTSFKRGEITTINGLTNW